MKSRTWILCFLILFVLVSCDEESDGPVVVATTELPAPNVEPVEPTLAPPPTIPVDDSYSEPPPAATAEPEVYPPPPPSPIPPDPNYPAPPTVAPQPEQAYPEPGSEPLRDKPDLTALNLELELTVSGLQEPIGAAHAGDGTNRLFVVQKKGLIRIVAGGVELLAEPFLDLTDKVTTSANEQGLLGLAFHPNFSQNGLFFVNYSGPGGQTVVSRFAVGDDPNQADPDSELVLLTQEQPAGNHNGGNLVFGPDGYLYVGLGDGGASGDQFGNGQNGQSWLGAMLRIDVDQEPYGVPADNPFVGDPAVLDEIWAIGLRNPWRYTFDRMTGDLYIADVGQNKYEEVHFQPAGSPGGQNYGWPVLEGSHCFPQDDDNCDKEAYELPVVEYDHSQGCSITGGYLYRGVEQPAFYGVYFFGDLCQGRIWGLARVAGEWQVAELLDSDFTISSFAEDEAGELYLLAMSKGEIYHLVSRSP